MAYLASDPVKFDKFKLFSVKRAQNRKTRGNSKSGFILSLMMQAILKEQQYMLMGADVIGCIAL